MHAAAVIAELEETYNRENSFTWIKSQGSRYRKKLESISEGRDSVRGWLSMDGKFVNTGVLTHSEYATSLGSTEEDFYRKGWVRLTAYGSDAIMGNNPIRKWNSRQRDAAILLASENWFGKVWFDDGKASKVVWVEPS